MIQINLLAHNPDRLYFTTKSLDFLKKIKETNKSLIKLIIVFSDNMGHWDYISNNLNENNIKTELLYVPHGDNNYLNKINSVINTECEYSCSMDDDILISNYVWDYIIENISILDDESNLFLAPLISNGIPSTDIFIEDFFNESDKNEIKNIFINTKIDNYWDVDYTSLNKDRQIWDMGYYDDVRKIEHYYKGIHPVRISTEAHWKIANVICENIDKMLSDNNFLIQKYELPYFCNSFYFIKTSNWVKIITNSSLFRDPYDEVPLNIFMQNNNLNMLFIRNAFCLHMAYNTIGTTEQKNIENYFIENFIKKL
jgi:hypothetical protein